jgi:hypothetical protein
MVMFRVLSVDFGVLALILGISKLAPFLTNLYKCAQEKYVNSFGTTSNPKRGTAHPST